MQRSPRLRMCGTGFNLCTLIRSCLVLPFVFLLLSSISVVSAETGREAWLRYAPLNNKDARTFSHTQVEFLGGDGAAILRTAQYELKRGLQSIFGADWQHSGSIPGTFLFVTNKHSVPLHPPLLLGEEGYWLNTRQLHGSDCIAISGGSDQGVLYGVFALL